MKQLFNEYKWVNRGSSLNTNCTVYRLKQNSVVIFSFCYKVSQAKFDLEGGIKHQCQMILPMTVFQNNSYVTGQWVKFKGCTWG